MEAASVFTVAHGLALIRIVVGLLFVGHGAQKLFGWFGGHGVRGTASWLNSLGLPSAKGIAVFAGLCELVGGLCLALGLLTPLAALAITVIMLGAIVIIHWPNGIWATNNGFEYPLVMLAIAVVIGLVGPGSYSLDSYLGVQLPQQEIYLAGLLLELVGIVGILALRDRQATSQRKSTAAT